MCFVPDQKLQSTSNSDSNVNSNVNSNVVSAWPEGNFNGMLAPGNINLTNRPEVKLPDGSTATVRSMNFEVDGKQVLVPTVSDDGKLLTPKEAIDNYFKTGKHLGIFDTPENAEKYAVELHNAQEKYYLRRRK